jgi:hypothetical protein
MKASFLTSFRRSSRIFRAAFFLFPCPIGLADLEHPDKGGQSVLQGGFAGIASAEDRVLLPSPCQRHLQLAGRREALVHGRALRSGQVISLGDEGTARSPALVQFADGDQDLAGGSLIDRSGPCSLRPA